MKQANNRRQVCCPECGHKFFTVKHGTTAMYDYYKCRCTKCQAANAARWREWKLRAQVRQRVEDSLAGHCT